MINKFSIRNCKGIVFRVIHSSIVTNLEREQVVGGREASRQGGWSWAAGREKKAGGQARSWLPFVEYKTTASEAAAAAAGGPGEGPGAGTDSRVGT